MAQKVRFSHRSHHQLRSQRADVSHTAAVLVRVVGGEAKLRVLMQEGERSANPCNAIMMHTIHKHFRQLSTAIPAKLIMI